MKFQVAGQKTFQTCLFRLEQAREGSAKTQNYHHYYCCYYEGDQARASSRGDKKFWRI